MINNPKVLSVPSVVEAKKLHTDMGRINWFSSGEQTGTGARHMEVT